MTRQEKIEALDNLIGMVDDNHGTDYDEALKSAKRSLEAWDKVKTNGDAIKMVFPNTTIFVDETHNVVWFELYHDKYDDDFDIDITFTLDWWNAPYKAESEEV